MKEEPVDILDEQGNETGQVLLKSEAHAKSLWHPVVHLWIYNSKAESLMQKRSPQKQVWPNLWDVAVAGHMAAGQSPEDALVREAQEELGLKVDLQRVKFIDKIKFEYPMEAGWINKIFIWLYGLQTDLDITQLTLEKEEVAEVKWIPLDELEKMLSDAEDSKNFSPDVRDYFNKVIPKIRLADQGEANG